MWVSRPYIQVWVKNTLSQSCQLYVSHFTCNWYAGNFPYNQTHSLLFRFKNYHPNVVPLWLSLPLTHWNSADCVVEPPGVQIRHRVNLVDLPEWRNTDVCIPVGCSPPWTGRLRKHRAVWTGRCICLLDERRTPVMVETVWSFKNKNHRDIIPLNGKHLLIWTHQYCMIPNHSNIPFFLR